MNYIVNLNFIIISKNLEFDIKSGFQLGKGSFGIVYKMLKLNI